MAYDFPASPSVGTLFAPAGGPTWQWNGTTWLATAPSGLVPEAPTDGQNYVRRNGVWVLAPGTAEAKNRIVNPCFQISQEWYNTVLTNPAVYYGADQWGSDFVLSTGAVTRQRVQVVTPNGSVNRFRMTVTTADTSIAAGEYMEVFTTIEGNRMADFQWGTSAAKQVILRFGWKSPAGTYGVSIANVGTIRVYVTNFTVTAGQANTDTVQTLVIPGDTTGTWANDTNPGMYLTFGMAAGLTYILPQGWNSGVALAATGVSNGVATVGNVFELFDVGLYLDPQNTGIAPPWVMPDEAEELRACMRYWERGTTRWDGYGFATTLCSSPNPYKIVKRVSPALTQTTSSQSNFPVTPGNTNGDAFGFWAYRSLTGTGPGFFIDNWISNARM